MNISFQILKGSGYKDVDVAQRYSASTVLNVMPQGSTH